MSKYNIDLPIAKLNKNGIATAAGWITVYNVEPEQREFQAATMEYLAVGVGLPAFSYADKPELPGEGLALVRSADEKQWETIADYRGQTAYNTETGQPEIIAFLGELPDTLTLQPPATPYDKWDGSQWVTDTAAQHADEVATAEQQKQDLLAEAQQQITGWQTELQLGIISDDDRARLIIWMNYIKAMQTVDTSTSPDITWPDKPE
ncbi:TPA: tail fiber assembly protein [Salmonella enterica subsp. enterica serovar Saintpaul str. CFSAN004147]|nr:tail fiber assembly protein [Salmonella enterica subsp. enterica serovar Saintpaul str. CFSAN004147]HCZ5289375.1 tail fiber assembly protein [Salmonella enterica subsp. enterica serovar Saintpaul str. CFSAN004154]